MTTTALRSTVDLWYGEPRPGPFDVLSPGERRRAESIESPEARAEFVAARTWLRTILAGYVGGSPAALRFVTGRWGKPRLVGFDVEFSVSHARGPVLVAVTTGDPVGVDVERHRPGVWDPRAAALVLTPGEMQTVRATPDPDRAFLTLWTRKEAYAKVSGEGLVDRLTSVDLRGDPVWVDDLEVRTLDLGPGVAAALACRRGSREVWRTR